tara:strand:- start:119 stop:265 length:147 start_codon:yes stop_codon:yes gene_type:complete
MSHLHRHHPVAKTLLLLAQRRRRTAALLGEASAEVGDVLSGRDSHVSE